MESAEFVGSDCGKHSSYTFFKAFKFRMKDRFKILTLGQFFFVKISCEHPLCVAELQLLWEDDQSKEKLSSTKLYYLPEDIPDGRSTGIHGQDELVAVSEKIVLRIEDLVGLIILDATWNSGRLAREVENNNPTEDGSQNFEFNKSLDISDIKMEKELLGNVDDSHCSVKIVSYPQYFRYRALERRLKNDDPTAWNNTPVIKALGGITVEKGRKLHIMFCRGVFDHPKLFEFEKCCNYLAPSLKGRPRKKRINKRSASPESESNDSVESKSSVNFRAKKTHVNGVKRPKLNLDSATRNEKQFYSDLFNFMKKRNTPIGRIPSLGFKSIDLHYFYKRVTQLGGYKRVSEKRLWKQMYEEVAGSQSSTSAATTTRKHYERLLLPYECSVRKLKDKISYRSKISSMNKETEKKEIKVRKVDSDSDEDGAKNDSTSSQDSEEQDTCGESTSTQMAEPETSSSSNGENKRARTVSPGQRPLNKKAKEDLQIEKEKKWDEIQKKNPISKLKTSGSTLPQPLKKITASATETKLENCKIERESETPPTKVTAEEECINPQENSTARPSVIQHAPLPIKNIICDINPRTRHSNSSQSSNSFPRLLNSNSLLVTPTLNSHIHSNSLLVPSTLNSHTHSSSSPSLSKSSNQGITIPEAHQSSIFKSSIDLIKKSIHPFAPVNSDPMSLITNKKAAHEASIPASQKNQHAFGKDLIDLSKKLPPVNSLPMAHSRPDTPQSSIQMNMPLIDASVEKKPSQFSPLMSLTSMSAKLSEKIRTSKTVKVPPMINTSSRSKQATVSNKSKHDVARPVFSVTPQVLENSSKPNSVVHPVQSTTAVSNNSPLVDPASTTNGHYSLPHYATSFPFIMPPNPAFSSGQFPHPYFPHAMFGLSYPGMLMPDSLTHQYRELMHRGLLPGQCQTSMYPSFPSLDSVSAQMYNASQNLLRPNFPSSKSANKP